MDSYTITQTLQDKETSRRTGPSFFFSRTTSFMLVSKKWLLLRRGERQDYCVLFSVNVVNSSKPQKKKLKINTNPPKETL